MLPVEQPFKTYTGKDGKPLENGYVYFGQPSDNPITAPIQVYWDADGSVPAAQPLRTSNGYIVRAGTPANVFVNSAYSEVVLDSKGRQVFYVESSEEFGTALALRTVTDKFGQSEGAGLVGFKQDAEGSVALTANDELKEIVRLEQFKLAGEGDWLNASNRACRHCYETGKTLRLRGRAYPGARIEVHGTFDVEGNGATVDFLGVGYTYIAGVGTGVSSNPSPWIQDPAIYKSVDYVPSMYSMAAPVAIGDDSITFSSVTGLTTGDIIFLGGNPSSASSPGNYIPTSFEFAQVQSISGNVVTLNGKIRNTFTTNGAAFKSAGLARGCRISGLRIKSSGNEAYQLTIRSALNVVIDNIEFAGRDTLGSATFVEGLSLRNLRSSGAGGNWSFARGTVSAYLDGLVFQYRSGAAAETNALFIEESCYDISLRNIRGYGASFSVRQMDMAGAVIKRAITISDSTFDTMHSPGGASSPFQCGTAAGVDIECINSTFAGAVVTPNSGSYPGITGDALCWITGNQLIDKIKFSACHFKSATAGSVFKTGGGAQGSVIFDDLCTTEGCSVPPTRYKSRGAWVNIAPGLVNGITITSGYTGQYRATAYDVIFSARVDLNGASTGTNFFLMPLAQRPQTEKRFVVATDQTNIWATVRITSDGDMFYVGSNGTPNKLDLQFTYPLDA